MTHLHPLPALVGALLIILAVATYGEARYSSGYHDGLRQCPAESKSRAHLGTEEHELKLVCSYPMPYASKGR